MEPWVSRSRSGVQLAGGLGTLLVGSALAWVTRDFGVRGENVRAGFLLGVLLLLAGLAALLVNGTQTVTIDPRKRLIEVSDTRRIGGRFTAIPFDQVVEISIGYLGKRSNFANTYYLVLHLADGRQYPLFAPGRFFEGASDRGVVEGWRTRLQGYLVKPAGRV